MSDWIVLLSVNFWKSENGLDVHSIREGMESSHDYIRKREEKKCTLLNYKPSAGVLV